MTYLKPKLSGRQHPLYYTERADAFVGQDLRPFLARKFPEVARRIRFNRLSFIDTIVVVFPPGTRPSIEDFAELESGPHTFADGVHIQENNAVFAVK